MTSRKKLSHTIAAAVTLLFVTLTVSCASTGNFMPLEKGEPVIGTVQATFVARNTLNGKDALNTQAYISLLAAAQGRYGGDGVSIDIRDIVWVSGKDIDNQNKEYAATGKVVQIH